MAAVRGGNLRNVKPLGSRIGHRFCASAYRVRPDYLRHIDGLCLVRQTKNVRCEVLDLAHHLRRECGWQQADLVGQQGSRHADCKPVTVAAGVEDMLPGWQG
jgi:hypothetical protein